MNSQQKDSQATAHPLAAREMKAPLQPLKEEERKNFFGDYAWK